MIKATVENGVANVSASARINHPYADEIMVLMGHRDRCRFPYTVEICLFKGSKWVQETVPEFAGYESKHEYGMTMYSYVPLSVFSDFLNEYGVS